MIRRKLPSGPTQALIPEMARKTTSDISEDLDKEMNSFDRTLKVLKRIKREIRKKSKSFRRELRKMYKKIVSIERLKLKAPKFSRDTSTKLRERNEANSGRRSKVLYKTLNGRSISGKKSSCSKSSCPPNSSTKPTILPNKSPENYEHDNQLNN